MNDRHDDDTVQDPDSLAAYVAREDGLTTLNQMLEDPELLAEPTPVVPFLCWPGRMTLLAGKEKVGKSLVAKAAAAAVNGGTPLFGSGEPTSRRVLYYSLEEKDGDLVRPLSKFRSPGDAFIVRSSMPDRPLATLRRDIANIAPTLCVFDSLSRLTQVRDLEPSTDAQWGHLVSDLRNSVRDTQTALLLIHHARRSDGRYRGSSAIGGTADMILEVYEDDHPNRRRVEVSGRLEVPDFAYERVLENGGGYRLELRGTDGDGPLEERIIAFVRQNPGTSTRGVRDSVRGPNREIAEALHELEETGRLEDRGRGQGKAWHVVGPEGKAGVGLPRRTAA